jgi:LuxR family maltose regulon positive regulatory protein
MPDKQFPKLNLPATRGVLIERPRLMLPLAVNPIVALIAPAGSGKTTLAMQWTAAFQGAVCWLPLSSADDSARSFWSFALQLFRLISPQLPEAPALLLAQDGEQVSEHFVDVLAEALAQYTPSIALVIDDAHFIQNPVLVQSLAYFTARLPASVRVVFIGRSLEPALLTHTHTLEQIPFTLDEVTQYFANQPQPPDVTTIPRIHAMTEGWVMGVKLAGIALRGGQDRLFHTANYSAQYLMDEALRQLAPDVLDFMLRTSIVDLLTPALCDALTERNDSAAQLESLLKAGLFITCLNDVRLEYRYHQMLREALLDWAHRKNPAHLHQSYQRAAAYYAVGGQYHEAAEQAHASGDAALVAMYVTEAMKHGITEYHPTLMLKWVESFPPMLLDEHPRLYLFTIMAVVDSGGAAALAWQHVAHLQAHPVADRLRGEIALAQAYVNLLPGGDSALYPGLIEQALQHLPHDSLYAYVLMMASLVQIGVGNMSKARALVEEQHRIARDTGNTRVLVRAITNEAYFFLADGAFNSAFHLVEEGITLIQQSRAALGWWTTDVEYSLRQEGSLALMYRGELSAADDYLLPVFAKIELMTPMVLSILYCQRGSIALLRRDAAAAEVAFGNATRVRGCAQPDTFNLPVQIERLRTALRYHDLQAARYWLDNCPAEEPPEAVMTGQVYVTVHARLIVGDSAWALEKLDVLEQQYNALGQPLLVTNVLALKAVAHLQNGDEAAARALVDSVMERTLPSGNVLSLAFLPLFPLLRQRIPIYWEAQDDARANHLRRIIGLLGEDMPTLPVTPFSALERDVALCVAQGDTTQTIADTLALSGAGVRYHVHNLHHKMLTRSREKLTERLRLFIGQGYD